MDTAGGTQLLLQGVGFTCKTQYVRGLVMVLNAMQYSKQKQQVCSASIASDGITFRWEDDSKTIQCSVFLKAELFNAYACPPGAHGVFGLQLSVLLDTLGVFASALSSAPLELAYPGPQGEVMCQMEDHSFGVPMVTYARLGAVELPISQDLADYWQSPDSFFLVQGAMLKEVVEDLEWPGGDVDIVMCPHPQRLAFVASGSSGDLTVELPVGDLSGFFVALPAESAAPDGAPQQQQHAEVRHRYRYKAMSAAFCHLPNPKEFGATTTKVSIDANGLLKATHMVSLHGPQLSQAPTFHADTSLTYPSDTQRPHSAHTAVLAYVTVPLVVEEEEREQ